MNLQTVSSISLTVLTGLTLFVLIKYTAETVSLRQAADKQVEVSQQQLAAMQKQNETQMLPIVVLDSDGTKLILHNLGTGPALDVGDVRIALGEKLWLNHQALIPPGQIIVTGGQTLIGIKSKVRAVKAGGATAPREVCIRYQGANGVWHETDQLLDVGETDDLLIKYVGVRSFPNKETGEAVCR